MFLNKMSNQAATALIAYLFFGTVKYLKSLWVVLSTNDLQKTVL